jgi:serine phosphatase RsbU (regulator of sigma subunit)
MIGAGFKKSELDFAATAVKRRCPVVFNDALNDPQINRRSAEKFGAKSLLVVPLIIRAETIGCLTFHHNSRAVPFNEAQIDFAGQLSTAVSFALENARLYAEKRHIADALQHSLLTMPKEVPGVRFGNLYRSATRTARVGGDFYDIFELPDNRVGIIIGDVSGKGLEAAKLTSLVKNTIRAYAAEGHAPGEVMSKTNDLTCQISNPSTFVTVFFGVLDTNTGELLYCGAGHPPAFIKPGSGAVRSLETTSPVIGIMPDFEFSTDRYGLKRGESLFLYTDGATDARCGRELFGEARLKQLVGQLKPNTIEELPHLVFAKLLDYSHAELADDLALLAVALT